MPNRSFDAACRSTPKLGRTAMNTPLWHFSRSVSSARQAAMAAFASYQQVLVALQSCEVQYFTWESPRDTALSGCERACFRLRVPRSVYDAFFNSPVGYRAQFALDSNAGYEGNIKALDAIEPALTRFAQLRGQADNRIVWSWRAPDAKIWIDESEVQEQLGLYDPQILYEPWQSQSEDGAGLLAPLGELLEVKGAWVDATGHFRPNPKKSGRAGNIHSVGFS
jgi:hypothetical protein